LSGEQDFAAGFLGLNGHWYQLVDEEPADRAGEAEESPFAPNEEPAVSPNCARPRTLEATPLSEIEMKSIRWLEKPLWQRSAFQLLAGSKGAGKGTYLAGLAARITRAGANVIFVATEDSAAIDLKPRLVAAAAVIERCFVIECHVKLPDDVGRLRELLEGVGEVALLVIDPVANHIGNRNSNSDGEVRDAIAPLNKLADELGCLIVGVRHPGKDRSRGALASILGSTAWVDTPRAVVVIAADDEDEQIRHIQVVAGNRTLNGAGQEFRIEAVEVAGLAEPITLAVELGESGKSVDELLAKQASSDKRVPAERVQEIILRELEQGERPRRELDEAVGRETGAKPDSVYKSGLEPLRKEGRIKARKAGTTGGWYWTLKEAAP
jgi:AAA domain